MNPTRRPRSPRPSQRLLWISAQLAIGVVALIAFAAHGDGGEGVACLAVMVASIAGFELARRRGLSVAAMLTGVGDERARGHYRAANARTGELMAYVLAVWAIITTAQGKTDHTLLAVVAAYAGLWCLNIARSAIDARGGVGRLSA
ncbi:MAG: hypothetical protein REI11_15910 [Patulibacter sp.]|nr:hypothetical protein [Patulibacter sp.]